MRSIVISVSVCLSVRSHIAKPHVQISPNFLYMLILAVARSSSDGSAIHCVLPVLWITSCFHARANGPAWQNQRRRVMFCPVRQGGGTWGEVCRLRLRLVFQLCFCRTTRRHFTAYVMAITITSTIRYLYSAPYNIWQRRWTRKQLIVKWSGAT